MLSLVASKQYNQYWRMVLGMVSQFYVLQDIIQAQAHSLCQAFVFTTTFSSVQSIL